VKDLIRLERARELQQQRIADEAAARAAALRGLTSDSYQGRMVHEPPTHPDANFEALRYEEPIHFDRNMHLAQKKGSLLAFPDLLAPTATKYADQDVHLYNHRSYPDAIPVSNTCVVVSSEQIMSVSSRHMSFEKKIVYS
jgi:hypothetical protein